MSTIRDIAREAGVSIGTVSHVLNHPDRVARATRAKVEHAMMQRGWQPNVAAQTLRRYQETTSEPPTDSPGGCGHANAE